MDNQKFSSRFFSYLKRIVWNAQKSQNILQKSSPNIRKIKNPTFFTLFTLKSIHSVTCYVYLPLTSNVFLNDTRRYQKQGGNRLQRYWFKLWDLLWNLWAVGELAITLLEIWLRKRWQLKCHLYGSLYGWKILLWLPELLTQASDQTRQNGQNGPKYQFFWGFTLLHKRSQRSDSFWVFSDHFYDIFGTNPTFFGHFRCDSLGPLLAKLAKQQK